MLKPKDVRLCLPAFFEDEDAEGNEEIRESFYTLPALQQQILRYAYENDLDDQDLGDIYNIFEYQAKQRLNRAVYALTDRMNADPYEAMYGRWDTRTKGRRAMSNAAARQLTNGVYGD